VDGTFIPIRFSKENLNRDKYTGTIIIKYIWCCARKYRNSVFKIKNFFTQLLLTTTTIYTILSLMRFAKRSLRLSTRLRKQIVLTRIFSYLDRKLVRTRAAIFLYHLIPRQRSNVLKIYLKCTCWTFWRY